MKSGHSDGCRENVLWQSVRERPRWRLCQTTLLLDLDFALEVQMGMRYLDQLIARLETEVGCPFGPFQIEYKALMRAQKQRVGNIICPLLKLQD